MKRVLPMLFLLALAFDASAEEDAYPLARGTVDGARADAERARGARFRKQKLPDAARDAYRRAYVSSGKLEDGRAVAELAEASGELAEAADVIAFLLREHDASLSARDKTKLSAKLTALENGVGLLTVDSKDTGARIVVDGHERGRVPLAAPLRLTPGRHYITVEKPDFEPFETVVDAMPSSKAEVAATLAAPIVSGKLRIEASGETKDARVHIDGKEVGTLPWEGDVDAGEHAVVVRSKRASSAETKVRVPLRKSALLALKVEPLMARARISATPHDAQILVNGNVVGRGSFAGDLVVGSTEVQVRAAGFVPAHFVLTLDGTDPVQRDVHLKPAPALQPNDDRYQGFYGGFAVAGSTDATTPACPAQIQCEMGTNVGAGFFADLGYRARLIGVGAALQVGGSYRKDTLPNQVGTGTGASAVIDEKIDRFEYGGFLGVGPRLMTKGSVALNVGLSPGLSVRHYAVTRNASGGVVEHVDQGQTAIAPSGLFDIGVLAGESPGAKLRFSLFTMATLHGDDVTTDAATRTSGGVTRALPPLGLASALQVTVGGMLGFYLGH